MRAPQHTGGGHMIQLAEQTQVIYPHIALEYNLFVVHPGAQGNSKVYDLTRAWW